MDQVDPHTNGGKTLGSLSVMPGYRTPQQLGLRWREATNGRTGRPVFDSQITIGRQGSNGVHTWHTGQAMYLPYSKPITRPQATDMFHYVRGKEVGPGLTGSYATLIPECEAERAARPVREESSRSGGNMGQMSCASELTRSGRR
ncbi:hypothetical protein IAT38_007633 [Cryptococcus sp. DSM 104549]